MVATDMVATVDTVMARGLLMLMLTMVATDMVAMEDTAMARGLLMLMLTMVATDMVATEDTAMARGLLMLMLTMVAMDTVVMDMEVTAMASNFINRDNYAPKKPFSKSKFLQFITLDLSNHYLGLNQIQFSF